MSDDMHQLISRDISRDDTNHPQTQELIEHGSDKQGADVETQGMESPNRADNSPDIK